MNILTTHSGKGPDDKVGIPDFGFRGPNTNTLFQSGFPLYAKKKRQSLSTTSLSAMPLCVSYRREILKLTLFIYMVSFLGLNFVEVMCNLP